MPARFWEKFLLFCALHFAISVIWLSGRQQTVFNDGKEVGFSEGKEAGRQAGWQDGIRALIQDKLSLGIAKENIIVKLQKFFQLPEEKACEYYDRFAAE